VSQGIDLIMFLFYRM